MPSHTCFIKRKINQVYFNEGEDYYCYDDETDIISFDYVGGSTSRRKDRHSLLGVRKTVSVSADTLSCSQGTFTPADGGHTIQIPMPDLVVRDCENGILALQKMMAGQVGAGHRMVGNETAVVGKMLYKGLQFHQHFLFT